jgi:hypothetical protein
LLGEIVHALPLFAAFSGNVDPVCRQENARFNKQRGDGPGSRNDASHHFLTAGTGCGNSAKRRLRACTCLVLAVRFRRRSCDKLSPRNNHGGTEGSLKPTPDFPVIPNYVQQRRPSMSNQNPNPGQQNQNPNQKPGQQQGGGQKPGQQQQDPNQKPGQHTEKDR